MGEWMSKQLTYRVLGEALARLGFERHERSGNGRPAVVFENPAYPQAAIYLPPMPLDEPVHPLHVGVVQSTLTVHGILKVDPAEVLLRLLTRNACLTAHR
jgi:hypothetical protein